MTLRLVQASDCVTPERRDCVCTAKTPCMFHAMQLGPRYVRRGRFWKWRVKRLHRKTYTP